MRKQLKRWGGSLVIVFTKSDCQNYGLKAGDIIELDDRLRIKKVENP